MSAAAPLPLPRMPRAGSLAEKVLLAEQLKLPPVEVAAFLQAPVGKVYAARRRLRRMGHRILRRWPDEKQRGARG